MRKKILDKNFLTEKFISILEKEKTLSQSEKEILLNSIISLITELSKINLSNHLLIQSKNKTIQNLLKTLQRNKKYNIYFTIKNENKNLFIIEIKQIPSSFKLSFKEKKIASILLQFIEIFISPSKYQLYKLLQIETLEDLQTPTLEKLLLLTLYFELSKHFEKYRNRNPYKFENKKTLSRKLKNTKFDFIIAIKNLKKKNLIKLNGKLIFELTSDGIKLAQKLSKDIELLQLYKHFEIELLTSIEILN